MAKPKPTFRLKTYGIYSRWNSDSRQLPQSLQLTDRIPAQVDIEFGLVIHVRGGKNQKLDYCIDHPGIMDDSGQTRPPFTGTVYVKSNDWNFFLGDTIWEPVNDKLGHWHLSVHWNDRPVAQKTLLLVQPDLLDD